MIRALLAGTKTQTRRVVKPQPSTVVDGAVAYRQLDDNGRSARIRCPYGVPGDTLWVREAHALHERFSDVVRVAYAASLPGSWTEATRDFPAKLADGLKIKPHQQGFRPSIHMPRWASRITLRITDVRVERLNDISSADAMAEGIERHARHDEIWMGPRDAGSPVLPHYVAEYARLWNHINGPGSWVANPWVWAVTFEVVAGI